MSHRASVRNALQILLKQLKENCSSGYIYIWGNDKCTPCPRGQFMPYSGRLKCLACPIDRTTVGEASNLFMFNEWLD
uniref:Tyrosine-protein kinase ephrin type A/B receptor-like domain-containing protein n=1 Tax=Meloidogyne incognita TaxID=6306 RepID=A0A914LSD8_MELIC